MMILVRSWLFIALAFGGLLAGCGIGPFPGGRLDGALYVDPAPERRWYGFIEADPRVRIQLPDDTTIYSARAVREDAPDVLQRYDAELIILRLDPD